MSGTTSLRQLQYYIALAESQSFRRAAARSHVSQPTITNQIAALERNLECQLFERRPSGTLLTPAGRELLPGARRVVEEFRGFLDAAESMSRGPVGTYRLGVTPTLGPYFLPVVLPEIHENYEALRFYVREDVPRALEDDLSAGEHDLVLTPIPAASSDLTVIPLFHEPLQLVIPIDHRLATKPVVVPADLAGEPVLTLQEHHLFHRQIEALCDRLGAHVNRDFEGTSLDTLRQMVVMGMGIAFLPALYVRSEIHDAQALRVTTVEGETMGRTHALAWRTAAPSHALFRKLADAIRDISTRELPELKVLRG